MAEQINAIVEPELDPKYDHYDFPITNPMTGSGHSGHVDAEQNAKLYLLRNQLESEGYTERLDTLTLVCPPPLIRGCELMSNRSFGS